MLKWTLSHGMIAMLGLFAMSDACQMLSKPVEKRSAALPVGIQLLKQYDLLGRNR